MKRLLPLLLLPVLLGSCAQESLTGDTYSRSDAGRTQNVRTGTITSIRYVKIEGGTTGGTIAGGVIGGVLGNQIGSGRGRDVATVAGAGAGAVAGSHIGQEVQSRQGIEMQIRLDGGGSISVVQEVNPRESFAEGDRVRALDGGGRTRVTH